jgi:hypothetical protein
MDLDTLYEELKLAREDVAELRAALTRSNSPVLKRTDAASYLGISERTLHSLRLEGKIKAVHLSPGRFVYRREELNRFLEDNERVFSSAFETAKVLFDEAMD